MVHTLKRGKKIAEGDRKARAIALRMRGFAYDDIRDEIPVAKSTLSSWLKDIKISESHRHRLQKQKMGPLLKFAEAKKSERLSITAKIEQEAAANIKEISKKDLWLIGIALYWALGLREDEDHYGLGVRFSSADADIVKVFVSWLTQVGGITRKEIFADIFLHESRRKNLREVIEHWSKVTGIPSKRFTRVYFQKNNLKRSPGKKIRYGLLRIRVRASTMLNRQISGWIQGIKKQTLNSSS